jgi:hypothetical protein
LLNRYYLFNNNDNYGVGEDDGKEGVFLDIINLANISPVEQNRSLLLIITEESNLCLIS